MGQQGAAERAIEQPAGAAQAVVDAINRVMFGPETTFENLTVVPLLRRDEREVDYLTLDEAIAGGWAQVTEVSDAGRVGTLRVEVKGTKPVLLLDGEELIGAKQNRVLNLTILAPAGRTIDIPVSCVEAGRWRNVSRGFASSPRSHFAEGRAEKMRHVTESLMKEGSRASDQGEVWNAIARKSARLEAPSDTSAMAAMYEKLGTSIDRFVGAFASQPGQVGAVFFINGVPAGLELFDAGSSWRKLAPKLIRSFAVDAIDRRDGRAPQSAPHDSTLFVKTIVSTKAAAFPAIGEGEDVRLKGVVSGAALVARGRAIHVSAFPVAES